MILSLDANVLIDLANGRRPAVRERFEAAVDDGHILVTCSIAAHELVYGAAISGRREAATKTARLILDQLMVAEFTREDAEAAAALRQRLRGSGQSIGTFDTLIAAQSLSHGWMMVTGNVREFARIQDLTVIDWTASAETL